MRGPSLLAALVALGCAPPSVSADRDSDDGLDPFPSDTDTTARDEGRTDCLALPPGPFALPTVFLGRGQDASTTSIPLDNLCDVPVEGLSLSIEGDPAFSAGPEDLPTRIDPFRQTTAFLSFRPAGAGSATATLVVSADGQDPVQIDLTAEATVPFLGLTPPVATVTAGPTCTRLAVVTVSNQGGTPLSVTEVDFSAELPILTLDPSTFTEGALPWTLAPDARREVRVAFAPERDDEVVDGELLVTGSAGGAKDIARTRVQAQAAPEGCE